ncbi:amino acid adenylation domain-containing protein [Pseudomonas sp. CCUG 57209]|uniref:non-ribosomal peptide synthase/polyketide synthase n=1 Tax=Pseudomonas sivasensis TaxID=1880678 RepID=UPI0015EBC2C9|nr:non-ribosomal peptide synthase/polyketide synthase [Pseudomonas sivasensis]MBA2930407.1 amino acid adenylation domain-containing protein [Pseudomonas sivasensis]
MNPLNQLPDDDLLALLMADDVGSEHSIKASTHRGPTPLSFAQQRLWFLQQLSPDSSAYNLPNALHLRGPLDTSALAAALQQIIDRHDVLKTAFQTVDDEPRQVLDPQARIHVREEDLSGLAPHARSTAVTERLAAEAGAPFDLGQAPLIRATLITLERDEHILLLNMHHIVSDAWSNPILMHDLIQAYQRACQGDTTPLARPAIQYADYARWQREEYPNTPAQQRAADYWAGYLGREIPTLDLPTEFPRNAEQQHRAGNLQLSVPTALSQQLHSFCQQQDLTPFIVLLGTWQLLLSRYSGQQDFTVGVPNASRNQSETHDLVGFFVSSQIYRTQLTDDLTTGEFLQALRQQSRAAMEHADYPIELIIERLQLQRSTQANPLFQTLFNWRVNQDQPAALTLGELSLAFLPVAQHEAKFDLSMDVDYTPQQITASIEYSTALFGAATIERLGQHWLRLLQSLVDGPQRRLAELPMLDHAEQHQMVSAWNATATHYPLHHSVQQLIEAQVAATPNATALVFGDQQLSYHQLNQRANQLAHKLMELGVGPDALVGIATERSLEMVIGLLAVLKAGGAYVPLDPEYPQDRLSYMIEDSGIGLLLTQQHLLTQLPIPAALPVLALDQLDVSAYADTNPEVAVDGENLAYVIYTSGSTGKPKGAGNRHSALTNRLCWMQQAYALTADDTVLQKTPFSFDVSVWEFFWPLMTGARLAVAGPGDHRDPAILISLIQRCQVTTLHFVPSMLQVFLLDEQVAQCTRLTRIICSGEALPVDAQQQVFAKLPNAGLFNLYGPTEAAIDVTHWTCREEGKASVPIGQPIANLTTYILDAELQPVPAGVIGELYLGGEGLARGYHRRPALTAERFMTSPFGDGQRLYRTGDLASYRPDGVIEYRGRIDHQVKIRGLRIELGEIETRLMELDCVREAVVIAADGQLVAYAVPTQARDEADLRSDIKHRLSEHLPDYMVPAQLIFLDQLPLSPNGKLDRKALPKPDANLLQKAYVAPQSPLEQQIAAIWQDVLKREAVGLHDDFFELGGHSLLATQVVSRVRHALNTDVPLRSLFECSTLQAFVATLAQEPVRHEPPLVRVARDQPLRLSYAQERQWFLWQLDPQSTAYHIPAALRLRGHLDTQALQRSFDHLIERHESLRTSFTQDGERTVQQIAAHAPLAITVESRLGADEQAIQACVEHEIQQLFDLQHGPLLRVKLLKLADDDHVLILTQHHIVSDGWSINAMIQELIALYAGFSQQQPVSLPDLPVQYADYGVWQRQWMEAGERERQLAYWTEQLGGEQTVLELPADHTRPSEQSYRGAQLELALGHELNQSLKQLAQQQGVTLFMLLLASFQTLLHRYSGQTDIRVGVPIANRNRVETEGLIGFFVNTQVLRAELNGQARFVDVLQQVKHHALQAQAHQDLPFEQLVEALQPERSLSHSPLFQVMYNHASVQPQNSVSLPGLSLEVLEGTLPSTQFDLSLDTTESADDLLATLTYAIDLFEASTVQRLAGHWQNLLQAIVRNPQQRLGELDMLGREERHLMLHDWSSATLDYPSEQRVHQLFEAQVAKQPSAPALLFEDRQLSYAELNAQANRLARHLVSLGVGPDVLVGIAVERGLDMIIGLLAVLKAGGAYVPLDPEYPQDRLLCMIEDSGTQLMLTQSHLRERLKIPAEVAHLCLDQNQAWVDLDDSNLVNRAHADNLAYVMFTSGSTGRPKGVGINQSSLTRHAYVSLGFFNLNGGDRILQFSTFNFDGFVEQLYPALICGASVVLRGTEIWDTETFYHALIKHQISVVDLTTAYWNLLAKDFAAAGPRDYGRLKQVHAGGEAMPPEGLAAWSQAGLGHVKLLNTYGPTEATVTVTALDCTDYVTGARPTPLTMPIGKVLAGRSIYLLDDSGAPAPIGVVGELVIGGELLARGYFNRPDLTAERFMPDPFSQSGGRLYRTGDLARYTPDGVIEYVGRIDHQVKIRGFRIELGEIEARLLEHDMVRDAIVLAQPAASGLQLVGYVVPEATAVPHAELRQSIKAALAAVLPDYMVPGFLMFLDVLPLSPNGKLDRKALPKPDASQQQNHYVAPRTALEIQVAGIWQSVLNLEQVGLTDDFFALGGHSLLATQIISRVRQALGLDVALRSLFERSVLGDFVAGLDGRARQHELPLVPVERTQSLPLSYAQERQWFLWQLDPHSAAYHLPAALRLKGALDVAALEHAFNQLIARHEALRTTFVVDNEHPRQIIADQAPLALVVETLNGTPDDATIKAFVEHETRQLFDLQNGPLLRVRLLRLADDEHVLVLTQHHIVSDGWSVQLMVEELISLYGAAQSGQPHALAPLPIQYADYAAWQRQWMQAGERERQLAYWTGQLAGEHSVLELPTDRPRPAEQSYRGAHLSITLAPGLGDAVHAFAHRVGVTPFMLLLASFQTLLHRYSGQNDIRVGVPIANRNRVETEGLIGFFVNTQVMKAEFSSHLRVEALLQQVKQHALDAQAHQDLPFEQLVEALQPERSLSHNPLFQVMFNHQSADKPSATERPSLPSALQVEGLDWEGSTSQFDLTLSTSESAEGLSATLTYATDLFNATTIERLGRHWQQLLHSLIADPQQRVADLAMLDHAEQHQMVSAWNATATRYPLHHSVQQLIEAQVAATPNATALVFGDQQLSYHQLNQRANQLAHKLMELGVGPDALVGIATERSLEMVIGLLAVLKAGAAYVPLDPEYPQDRLSYMIEDSGIGLLLTQQHLLTQLPIPAALPVLALDQLDVSAYADTNPEVAVDGENLAYVIYTSGSTGKPKGAGNRHSALTNRLCWMQQAYGLTADDTVLQKTPLSFDVSVWEFFWTLMTGARLAVAGPGDHRDPAILICLIQRYQITTLHFVPSMLQVFLLDEQVAQCTGLTRIICSGEALPVDAQQQVFTKLPNAGLFNLYGPTEAAIDVTHWTCREEGKASVPIGQPIANLTTYILDAELQPVPAGVIGELYLGGEGLARGYHRRPALTAERFMTSPFGDGQRLYRTGDLASYRPDGVIEYRGRIDHQVKIRGLRIELGEIETRLMELDCVREAVVIAADGQLVAYAVPAQARDVADLRSDIKHRLSEHLPDYMVPAQLIFLDQLPLSPNGKLDRKALPKPDANLLQKAYVAPQSPLEQQIAAIWQDVLKLERVGLNDNFFELGGDSIISIQVVSRARQQGIAFTPKELFQHQTVQGLASVARIGASAQVIDQGPATGPLTLLPIHQVFFETAIPERHHWNQSVLLQPAQPVVAEALQQALHAVIEHHDALRLSFEQHPGGWSAQYRPMVDWQLQQIDATAEQLSDLCDQAQGSLDLQHGPLIRALLIHLADGTQRLLLVIHHLAVDGVSWRILFEDLQNAYQQVSDQQPVQLPARTSSVKAWAERLQRRAQNHTSQDELNYWLAQLDTNTPDLPCERPHGSLDNRHSHTLHTHLDARQTKQLLQQAPKAYRTQINDLLLTALARVISRWTGAPHCLIELEGHGREDLFDDIDLTRTVGWFTSLFPVKLVPAANLGDSIKQIKEQLRAIPDKGLGYGALRYLGTPQARASLGALQAPRITFNYLGQFDGSFDASQGSLLAPAAEGSGREQALNAPLGNWLSLNGQVYGDELTLGWQFSREMFDEATIAHLADDLKRELLALIEHCCDTANVGVTPSDFPLARISQAQLDRLPVPLPQVEDVYPLSAMQQGMLFHTLEAPESALYVNQMAVSVTGLDVARFTAAWNAVIERHEILRTGFWADNQLAEPLQVVYRAATMPVDVLDWQQRDVTAQDLEVLASQDCARGFELLRAPLTRLTLVQLDPQTHYLIWTSHHILMDGWSNSRLLGEVFAIYNGQAAPAKRGHYRDYIRWLQDQSQAVLEQFWKTKLQDLNGTSSLANSLSPKPAMELEGHAALYLNWDALQTAHLREQAQRLRVTPNTLIQATWLLLLQRYTGQDTVCFGATVAGRPASLPGSEDMLGLFINTLPIIQTPQPHMPVAQWLQALQAYNLEVRDHEHASLADVQRWSGQGGQPLFDSILVFENYPVDERLQEAGQERLSFGDVSSRDVTNFAMDLAINLGDTLKIEFLYLRNRFTEAATAQILRSFETLLLELLNNAQANVGSLTMLAGTEQQLLLQRNVLSPAMAPRAHLAQVIRQHALERPDAVAVVCDGIELSYGELDARANRLAHCLMAQGIGPEMFVGVALERSVDVIVAFYGVMKTGAAYVPLDIDYPQDRVQWIVEDSAMSVLISQHSLRSRFDGLGEATLIDLDRLPLSDWPATCPAPLVHDDNLAYLIYTSGSTGKPKGVAVTHGQIRMHCQAIAERYEMDSGTRELLFMSFAFDGAQERWLSTLQSGGCLVVRGNQLWTPEETWQALHAHSISIACFPPAYLQQLAEYGDSQTDAPPPVRIYCFGGDAVAEANFELVKRVLKPQYLTNGYGPTETVVTPLLWKVSADERCNAVYAPIGTRVGERTLYVLDEHLNPVPDGVAGELYIGGEGVARGYHQRPGLSAERFVVDPFAADGTRLYRTGDLVRQRPDGVIDYLGRLDNQVKIRGFRIELGEIESRLREIPDVQDAVVVARDTAGGKQLIGYVVADASAGLGERLRAALQVELPDYMVPAQILALPAFPLNPNGKLDRLALPDPDFKGRAFVAPRNALEAQLAAIWQEVLELESVGVTDNFFELGGDSLRILKVLSKVRSQPDIGIELKLRDMIGKPTIAELSGFAEDDASLNPLLLLNSETTHSSPLFCLHAGFGTVFDYEPLARRLDGQRSVYGLQCRMLLDRQWNDDSLASMAIDYSQYIRQQQASGPYHLVGWSLGGTLAVLVAQELESQGQRVEFLGLVDSFVPTGEDVLSDDWSEDLRGFLAVLFGLSAEALPTFDVRATTDSAVLEQLIAQVQAGAAARSVYAAISTEELAHTFQVAMKLKALSTGLDGLPPTRAQAHCWWAKVLADQPASNLASARSNEQIAAGHYDMLNHPTLLQGLLQHLALQPVAS